MKLSVDVGLGDMVHVYQRYVAHTTSGKCFARPGSDTAYSNDSYAGLLYTLGSLCAKQTGHATEASVNIRRQK